jgi:hypothetical protein
MALHFDTTACMQGSATHPHRVALHAALGLHWGTPPLARPAVWTHSSCNLCLPRPSALQATTASRRRLPEGLWTPGGWLDVVEPVAVFLREVLTRFQQPDAFEARRGPLQRIWAALHSLLGPGQALDLATCGVRGRQLQDTVRTVDRWVVG